MLETAIRYENMGLPMLKVPDLFRHKGVSISRLSGAKGLKTAPNALF